MGNEADKKADRGNPGYETPDDKQRSARTNRDDDYDEEGRVGGQNQYFGLSLQQLMKKREDICKPEAYSDQWLEIFVEFEIDPDTI